MTMRARQCDQKVAEARAAYANDLRSAREEHDREVSRLRNVYENQQSNLTEQLAEARQEIATLMERMMERYLPIPVPFQDGPTRGRILTDPWTGLVTDFEPEENPYQE